MKRFLHIPFGRRGAVLFAALAAAALGAAAIVCRLRCGPVPQGDWRWTTPESAGFKAENLHAFADSLGGEGCIVYQGRMVHAWGKYTNRHDLASVAKPVYAHFALKALEEGLIESLDQTVVDWVPELTHLNPDLGYKDRGITFRHLLNQTSGYALREPPGVAFAYNDYQTGFLLWTLLRRVYACGYVAADRVLLGERLGDRIGFQDAPSMLHRRSHPGRIRMSARDLARFGLLYLRRGRWGRQTVLRKELVRLALNSPIPYGFPRTAGDNAQRIPNVLSIGGGRNEKGHAGAHSFFWWINRKTESGRRLLPDAPPRTFLASGYGGRNALVVIPELDLVIVWLDAFNSRHLSPFDTVGRRTVNRTLRTLLEQRRAYTYESVCRCLPWFPGGRRTAARAAPPPEPPDRAGGQDGKGK